ncbi:MAG: cohesin domain-containing protein, partial [Dehalococcoidia bacterium]
SAPSAPPTAGLTPGAPRPVVPTTASVPPDAGFTLTVPPSSTGSFDVAANIVGAPAYRAFSISLVFDASLLRVTSVDYGGAMAPAADVFCPAPQISAGKAGLGCTRIGPDTTTNSGVLAIFHFQVLAAGTSNLHFQTYAEVGSSNSTYLVVGGTGAAPLLMPLHDATVTVAP